MTRVADNPFSFGEPSEAAVFAAEVLAATMSRGELLDLERMLAHSVAHPKPAELREARLGLLIELCTLETGEVPTEAQYESERAARTADDERWPHATTLGRAFYGWDWACRAAMRLAHAGSAARVSHAQKFRKGKRPPYTRQEVIAAFSRFRDRKGRWPNFSEFLAWGQVEREHARLNSREDPRIPSMKVITRMFGDFGRALTAARRADRRP
jgi:hypothetical protein